MRLALAAAVVAIIAAAAFGGRASETVAVVEDACVQRVKVWSPSRQATVMGVQNFCS